MVNGQLVTNASTLRHEEHKRYDQKLVQIARQRLNGIDDLRRRGLVTNLGGLGVILSMYERVGDMTQATVSMDGLTPAQKDRLTFDEVGVPIPVFHEDWSLNLRQIEASRTRGEPLPTTQIAVATRLVADRMEDALFNGIPGLVVDGKQVYGYTTHPDRNTGSVTAAWATATGVQIVGDVKLMLQQAYDDNFFGPFVIYVAKDIWANIQTDYSASKGDNTIADRIEAFRDIAEVRPGDALPSGNVTMVQMTEDVVDLAVAQDIRNIQWQTNPMKTDYKVFSVLAPRIKSEKNGKSGIVHYS